MFVNRLYGFSCISFIGYIGYNNDLQLHCTLNIQFQTSTDDGARLNETVCTIQVLLHIKYKGSTPYIISIQPDNSLFGFFWEKNVFYAEIINNWSKQHICFSFSRKKENSETWKTRLLRWITHTIFMRGIIIICVIYAFVLKQSTKSCNIIMYVSNNI